VRAAGMCLPIRYLAMDVSSDFTIADFGLHVTILRSILGKRNVETGYVKNWPKNVSNGELRY
jgi:hypothetical protein